MVWGVRHILCNCARNALYPAKFKPRQRSTLIISILCLDLCPEVIPLGFDRDNVGYPVPHVLREIGTSEALDPTTPKVGKD